MPKIILASVTQSEQSQKLASLGIDIFIKDEKFYLVTGDEKASELIEFGPVSIQNAVFVDLFLLSGKKIKEKQMDLSNAEMLFKSSDVTNFFSRYNVMGFEPFMFKGHTYSVVAALGQEYVFSNTTFFVAAIEFLDNSDRKGKHFDMYVIFDKNDEAYFKRTVEFFGMAPTISIIPKEHISPIIYSKDIDKLFISVGPYEPMIKSATLYRLIDVGLSGTDIYIKYLEINKDKRNAVHMMRIETYPDNAESKFIAESELRRRGTQYVYNFFKSHINDFFASAEDIYPSMLNFMAAPSAYGYGLLPFPIIFSSRPDWLVENAKSYENKWNLLYERTPSASRQLPFPLRIP